MKIKVAILGGTGPVGQKAVALLQNHNIFELSEIATSSKNIDKNYGDIVNWKEQTTLNDRIAKIKMCASEELKSPFILSALPAGVAKELEPLLANKGHHIFSNASAWRMHPDVPLMVPELNSDSIDLLKKQPSKGKIVTNPNCTTVFFNLAIAPLLELARVKSISLVTMQAISGAGNRPGVSALDISGNIIPYIEDEEDKIEKESKKILQKFASYKYDISVNVHRVPVLHGHTMAIHIYFDDSFNNNKNNNSNNKKPISAEDATNTYLEWNKKHHDLFVIHQKIDHPQPAFDLTNFDYRVHIGRIRQGENKNILSLVALGHNLVRGAAGAAIRNMEFCYDKL
ncbi:MAG: aspartate-semialdehyde dehydrogenase [Oligoflexia bacterium]|nr:aspartate-semialdehyde dehydrogenase [Oligoflexia bacterium]